MQPDNSQRERKKIKELANDYISKGYRVVVEPHKDEIPNFLSELNYIPDLIVESDEETLIIEVTSNKTAERLREIIDVVDIIEERRGWRFILVVTNSKPNSYELDDFRHPEYDELVLAFKKIQNYRASVEFNNFHSQSLLLMTWSVLEGLLRMYLFTGSDNKKIKTSKSLVRDAVMMGFLDPKEGDTLDKIVPLRNAIAHGAVGASAPIELLDKLIKICANHLSNSDRSSADT